MLRVNLQKLEQVAQYPRGVAQHVFEEMDTNLFRTEHRKESLELLI